MKRSVKNSKRVVVKIGSSLFYDRRGRLDFRLLKDLCRQVAELRRKGTQVVIVSSGAIALGMSLLKLSSRPKELADLQAAASLGQNELMDVYRTVFGRFRLLCGQMLLTWEDFSGRSRYLNAKNTLNRLLDLGIVPVINENDTVSTDEIKFGDNDQLSSLVAGMACADLLVILSDVPGLLGRDKKVVRLVETINEQVLSLAGSSARQTSVGGMVTKLKAARVCADAGIACVIAAGRSKDILTRLSANPAAEGTLFVPKAVPLSQLQHWIAYSTKPKGTVVVDDGAVSALAQGTKSLLSVGVTGCSGGFKQGDVVAVVDCRGREIARGKVSLSHDQLEAVKGRHSDREVIHCDNLVVI